VDPDRVLDQLNDLPTAIREERLPFLDAPGRQTSPRVARAEKLGQVGPVERDEVPDLLPKRLHDGDPLARLHRPEAGVTRRNHERAEILARHRAPARAPLVRP